MALLYLDLDGFKPVNDLHGHQLGDALLSQVAARLCACLGPGEDAFRIGGDEFIVILSRVRHQSEVTEMARRLTACVSEPFALGPEAVRVGASIGIVLSETSVELDDLMARADVALYEAKRSGRGMFRFAKDASALRLAS
ncbi:diguanylate cyclase domain-containing protein [Sphingomonas radiodurans]|uniref:diguanylate cyclase domain-containing protein n=1 Tax=Sphingomonas radiodurans TaxID=2890321 RepID=UPI001E29D868|nr:GGDEF domain-containing protein [Sphingomonas radiodurans]WBH15831.1 GGDEF domain-containing protein [Sphingomonas radiodurans]